MSLIRERHVSGYLTASGSFGGCKLHGAGYERVGFSLSGTGSQRCRRSACGSALGKRGLRAGSERTSGVRLAQYSLLAGGGGEGCVAGFPGARPRTTRAAEAVASGVTDLPTGSRTSRSLRIRLVATTRSRLRPYSPAQWRSVFTYVFTSPSRRASRQGPAGLAAASVERAQPRAGPARAPGEASRSLALQATPLVLSLVPGTRSRPPRTSSCPMSPSARRRKSRVAPRIRRDLSVGLEALKSLPGGTR